MTFGEVIVSLTSGAAASGLLMWLFKEWLSTRLKASIQHEYERKLETHKAQLKTEQELAILDIKTALAREAAFHAAAHASFSEGQKASMERKLGAVDRLWACIPQFRARLPPVLLIIDVMTVDEYRAAKDHPQFKGGDPVPDRIAALVPTNIEEVRPYVGEYMWAVFFCYQTILIRVLVLLQLLSLRSGKGWPICGTKGASTPNSTPLTPTGICFKPNWTSDRSS